MTFGTKQFGMVKDFGLCKTLLDFLATKSQLSRVRLMSNKKYVKIGQEIPEKNAEKNSKTFLDLGLIMYVMVL